MLSELEMLRSENANLLARLENYKNNASADGKSLLKLREQLDAAERRERELDRELKRALRRLSACESALHSRGLEVPE